MKWWEKTIEYSFVRMHLPMSSVIYPLDGWHEQAGDALLRSAKKWIMIEFKVDENAIKTEEKKFYDFQSALNILAPHDSHHFIVYGSSIIIRPRKKVDDKQHNSGFNPIMKKRSLVLCATTYFSRRNCDMKEIFSSGVRLEVFKSYVNEFLYHKNNGPGGGGMPTLTLNDYALVAGIDDEGAVVACMSLIDFGKEIGLRIRANSHGLQIPSRS